MNILFVCKHNRFRSKVAEALFKKYNKDKAIHVLSAGTHLDYLPVSETVKNALKKFQIYRINPLPKKLTKKLLKWSDLIVIVANDASVKAKGKKVLKWKITDVSQGDYKGILIRSNLIRKRIKSLIHTLG